MKKTVIILTMILTVFLASSCISPTRESRRCDPDTALLEQRINAVWDLKVHDNWTAVYDFTSENYRKNHKKENFATKSNVVIQSYSIDKIQINPDDPEKADVSVKFKINQMGFNFPFVDSSKWIFENCNWYIFLPDKA